MEILQLVQPALGPLSAGIPARRRRRVLCPRLFTACIHGSALRPDRRRRQGLGWFAHQFCGADGAGCPWVTMERSWLTHMDTVTGECQPCNRWDKERSTCSWLSRICQLKSPYPSSPKVAARLVRSPAGPPRSLGWPPRPGRSPFLGPDFGARFRDCGQSREDDVLENRSRE